MLREIFLLCLKFDITFQPQYINTKVNVLSDSLSRQDWETFWKTFAEWKQLRYRDRDEDDWKLFSSVFEKYDSLHPFHVDTCCDDLGGNSHLLEYWTRSMDARVQCWDAKNCFCNPPFSLIIAILLRFLVCKERCQVATAALFVLPDWDGEPFLDLIYSLPLTFDLVERFPAGSELFTAPVKGQPHRRYCGVTRWDVLIFRVHPSPMKEAVDWVKWKPFLFDTDR